MKQQINFIIQRKGKIDPNTYSRDLQSVKTAIQRRLKILRQELHEFEDQYRSLQQEHVETHPIDQKWSEYYQAWTALLKSKTVGKAALRDLVQFREQIAERLEKQTKRLQRLRDYSVHLKDKVASKSASNSSRRARRIEEVREILKEFNARMEIERNRGYDGKIVQANDMSQQLSDELEQLNAKRSELEEIERKLRQSNQELEEEVIHDEETISERRSKSERDLKQLEDDNEKTRIRIEEYRTQISQYESEIMKLDDIIDISKHELANVKITISIAETL